MSSISNRAYARIVVAIALGAFATCIALAQQPASTWQQIKQRGELRIGVTPGEPWYFKDPATDQWSGIGYRMGQQIAKDLGVKLVPVETTWGNSVAAIQANQIDVMFVLDATDERKKAVDFPDAPFFWYAQGVLVRDGLQASNWADLDRDNVKIAVTMGILIQALIQAINAGADEALMLDPHGFVASCNSTNFFIVRGEELWTSTGRYNFKGITRRKITELYRVHGGVVREIAFTLAEVYSANEAFVTGTLGGVTAVTRVDGRTIATGEPGAVTRRISDWYEEAIGKG